MPRMLTGDSRVFPLTLPATGGGEVVTQVVYVFGQLETDLTAPRYTTALATPTLLANFSTPSLTSSFATVSYITDQQTPRYTANLQPVEVDADHVTVTL